MKSINLLQVHQTFGRTKLQLMKHSPDILLAGGLIGMMATIFLASKATLELESIIDDTKQELEHIEVHASDQDNDKYSDNQHTADVVKTYGKSALKIGKLYGPAIAAGTVSTFLILGSRGILTNRNTALMSAYTLLGEAYGEYRKRVVEEYGGDKDQEFHLGYKEKTETETVIDENGDKVKKKIKTYTQLEGRPIPSVYAAFFDENSREWRSDRNSNKFFVVTAQKLANEKLKAQKHLFLNEVLDMLGIPRTRNGALVGWIYNKDHPTGDNMVDFGLWDINNPGARDFVNGYNPSILLDFNVDGIIYKLI